MIKKKYNYTILVKIFFIFIIMGILLLMILSSLSLGLIFLLIFLISVKNGQFDDCETPAIRILFDDVSLNNEKQVHQNI